MNPSHDDAAVPPDAPHPLTATPHRSARVPPAAGAGHRRATALPRPGRPDSSPVRTTPASPVPVVSPAVPDSVATRGYGVLVDQPGGWVRVAAGLVGRLPVSMLGLGSLLLVADVTGSYGQAGAVSATLALAGALAGPVISRLIDRAGARRVLLILAGLHVLAGTVFGSVVLVRAPTAVMLAAAALTGATLPQVGAVARERWATLLADSPTLQSAYALESVLDEVSFAVGPAAAGLLAGALPPAGLIVALACAATAVPLFAALPTPQVPRAVRTTPVTDTAAPPGTGTGTSTSIGTPSDAGAAAHTGATAGICATAGPRSVPVALLPGMPAVIIAFAGLGGFFGAGEVALIALGREHGWGAGAGLLPVLITVVSLLSGLVYGARPASGDPVRRFALAGLALAAAAVLIPATDRLVLVVVGAGLAGLPLAPLMILGNTVAGRLVPPTRRTEGFTWLTAGTSVGAAVSSPLCGMVVDAAGARAATVAIPISAGLAAAGALLAARSDPARPAVRDPIG